MRSMLKSRTSSLSHENEGKRDDNRGKESIQAVRAAIAERLPDQSHDDGSFGPLLIRLAWHTCGTFDAEKGNGGSNGGTMRFQAEQKDPENSGLAKGRALLEPVKQRFPWISYSDLWVLAGNVAIEESGGPFIPFRRGRIDFSKEQAEEKYGASLCPFGDGQLNPVGSRLPAADLGTCPLEKSIAAQEKPTINHVRGTFQRMGFDDRETVLLIILGHQFGRCHAQVSGFEEAWYPFAPTEWNVYERGLGYMSLYDNLHMLRERTTAAGRRQFEANIMGLKFMMLPVDRALGIDPGFRQHVNFYNRNRSQFRVDCVKAWTKLTELGCEGILSNKAE